MSETPVFHYFKLGRLGRGEVVRLFLHDAGIDFKDELYEYGEEWQKKKEELNLNATGSLPVLDIDGHRLSQHLPILRYLSRRQGSYDGESSYDKFLVDAVSDIYTDWRNAWATQIQERNEHYNTKTAPWSVNALDAYYKESSGPYLLGDKVTYVDFAVYQMIDNDAVAGAKPELPESLSRLVAAVKERPNIKEYLAKRDAA